jgi:transmembrane sensor
MEERIKYLFNQYFENNCSREELEELFSYIRAADNDELLRSFVKKAYDDTREKPSSQTYVNESGSLILTGQEWLSNPALPKKRSKKRWIPVLAIAACLVTAAAIVWLTREPGGHSVAAPVLAAITKKTTERSEYKYVLLPDSTQVWLNASSSLEFPDHFNAAKREVTLSGEAYFDVKHADKIPFIIHTGKIATTVLGTAFNIKAYPDRENIIISVSRGKVRVSYNNTPVATLIKGQQVKVSSLYSTTVEKKIAPAAVAAWQQGNMCYEDEAFEDIIADLQRLYNVNIKIDNASIRNLKVSTSFRREIGIEQALQVLCQLTDTVLKQENGWYTIQ